MGHKRSQGVRVQLRCAAVEAQRRQLQEVFEQQGDILAAFTQRWQLQGHHVEAVIKVAAKLAALRFDRGTPELDRHTLAALTAHDWPGNVRELRNVAERFALGLPVFKKSGQADSNALGFNEAVEAFERNLLGAALERHAGNLSQAAQALGLAKTTLFDKVKKYGLQ